jgi:hypothetical protein
MYPVDMTLNNDGRIYSMAWRSHILLYSPKLWSGTIICHVRHTHAHLKPAERDFEKVISAVLFRLNHAGRVFVGFIISVIL